MAAACSLVERLGGVVAKILFVVELAGFRARETTLAGRPVTTLLVYEGK
jgi:adenine phosphoribosyltransferase